MSEEIKKVDHVILAELMVKRAELEKEVEIVEASIWQMVFRLEETQKIAGVEAKYSPESKRHDYEAAAKVKDIGAIHEGGFTFGEAVRDCSTSSTTTSTKWKEVCKLLDVDLDYLEPSKIIPPQVTITVKGS